MFKDYANRIYKFTHSEGIDNLRKKNVIINLPFLLKDEQIDNPITHQEIVNEFVAYAAPFKSNAPILFAFKIESTDFTATSYFVYEIFKENVPMAIKAYLKEKIQAIKEHDLLVRKKIAIGIAPLFDTLMADSSFSKILLDNLKTSNVDSNFRIDHSSKKHKYINIMGGYFVELNIRPTDEHKSFLKKVLDIVDDKDIFYRGYIMFSNILEVIEIKFKLYSSGDLNHHHFELESIYGQLCIKSKEKNPQYTYKERLDTFYQLFDPTDYKFTLYQLLRFHHDWGFRGSITNKYIKMFPELYTPSAYDFSVMTCYELDSRFLLQDMIDI